MKTLLLVLCFTMILTPTTMAETPIDDLGLRFNLHGVQSKAAVKSLNAKKIKLKNSKLKSVLKLLEDLKHLKIH